MQSIAKYFNMYNENIKKEYDNLQAQGNDAIIKINDRIMKFQEKAEKTGGTEKKKYQFLVDINQALLNKTIREIKEDNLWYWARRRTDPIFKYHLFEYPFLVWDLEYEDIDWRCKINFLKMPVSDCEKMQILYKSKETKDREKYIEYFELYIKECEICQGLKDLTKSTYVSKDRIEVMEDAIDLFEKGRYLSFINLAADQLDSSGK